MTKIRFKKSDIKIKQENCRYEYHNWNFSATCYNDAVEKARDYYKANPNKFTILTLEELANSCANYDLRFGRFPESEFEGKAIFEFIIGETV